MTRPFRLILSPVGFVVYVLAGTTLLFMDVGNVWLRAGFAVLTYASAFRSLGTDRLSQHGVNPVRALRIWAIAATLAGALGFIGSLLLGGAIGWLGVFLSLRFGLTGVWVLWTMTTWRLGEDASR
jgi:hypothetical protein